MLSYSIGAGNDFEGSVQGKEAKKKRDDQKKKKKGGGAAAVADMTMAAKESVNNDLINVERVVNRWIVNYYLSLGVEFFKNEQYTDFSDISKVLDGKLIYLFFKHLGLED